MWHHFLLLYFVYTTIRDSHWYSAYPLIVTPEERPEFHEKKSITLAIAAVRHFSEKHFRTSKNSPRSWNILTMVLHQSINWTSIDIIIKTNLEKARNSMVIFFEKKMGLLKVKEFYGLHDDLKIIKKEFTRGGQGLTLFIFFRS